MRKKGAVKKRQNIVEEGPDAEAFAKWKAQNSVLRDKGAETNNAESYAPADTPDNAVCVDVFRISQGGLKMEKEHFFTKAEAPIVAQPE